MGVYRTAVLDRLDVPARVRLPEGDERAYRLFGRPIPQAIPIRLIIDTGAKRSSLVPQVLNQLAPTSASRATDEIGLGMRQTELYWVRLEFMAGTLAAVPRLAVARLPLPSSLQEYHGLIGRDLLSKWYSLLYEGQRGQLTIRDSRAGFFSWFAS